MNQSVGAEAYTVHEETPIAQIEMKSGKGKGKGKDAEALALAAATAKPHLLKLLPPPSTSALIRTSRHALHRNSPYTMDMIETGDCYCSL